MKLQGAQDSASSSTLCFDLWLWLVGKGIHALLKLNVNKYYGLKYV
jgi:hypothetical protein